MNKESILFAKLYEKNIKKIRLKEVSNIVDKEIVQSDLTYLKEKLLKYLDKKFHLKVEKIFEPYEVKYIPEVKIKEISKNIGVINDI